MEFQDCFPIWAKLSEAQRGRILASLVYRQVKKGTVLHSGADCTGLLLVESGQLRAYILSEEGREVTVYRLFDRRCRCDRSRRSGRIQ